MHAWVQQIPLPLSYKKNALLIDAKPGINVSLHLLNVSSYITLKTEAQVDSLANLHANWMTNGYFTTDCYFYIFTTISIKLSSASDLLQYGQLK